MITIVSGLPRSGTSLVMQMLQAGGHPVLSDGQRMADGDNPRGYLEDERVRALERDATWLGEAEGKALKVVSPLLRHLPAGHDCRVIFVERDLDEVLRSQERMLANRGQPTGPDRETMKAHFERHLQSVATLFTTRPEFQVLRCHYRDLVEQPSDSAGKIARFLPVPLDVAAMTAAVDATLYRQRSP